MALVVWTFDIAIHRINLYPVDNAIILVLLILNSWILIYPMDSQRAKKIILYSLPFGQAETSIY